MSFSTLLPQILIRVKDQLHYWLVPGPLSSFFASLSIISFILSLLSAPFLVNFCVHVSCLAFLFTFPALFSSPLHPCLLQSFGLVLPSASLSTWVLFCIAVYSSASLSTHPCLLLSIRMFSASMSTPPPPCILLCMLVDPSASLSAPLYPYLLLCTSVYTHLCITVSSSA